MLTSKTKNLSYLTAGLTLLIGGAAYSQSIATSTVALNQTSPTPPESSASLQAAISRFAARYHTNVALSSTPMPAAAIDSAPPTARLRHLQRLALDSGRTWAKVYQVSPADTGMPVTDFAAAKDLVDQQGVANITGGQQSALDIIKQLAADDNASVEFNGFQPHKMINADWTPTDLADSIAVVAQRTHTHWTAMYVIAPREGRAGEIAVGPAKSSNLTYQQYEASQLFNGPITIHTAPVPAVQTASAATSTTNQQTAANSSGLGDQQATGANGAAPASDPYGYRNSVVMQNGYAYNQLGQPYQTSSFSFTGNPYANPWAGQTIIFSGKQRWCAYHSLVLTIVFDSPGNSLLMWIARAFLRQSFWYMPNSFENRSGNITSVSMMPPS